MSQTSAPLEKASGAPLIFSKAGKCDKDRFGKVVSASTPDSIHVSIRVEGLALYEDWMHGLPRFARVMTKEAVPGWVKT